MICMNQGDIGGGGPRRPSPKRHWLERPNGVSHLPQTPTRFATRICNETGHSDVTNAHRIIPNRCCASSMHDCAPNIAQCASCTIRPCRPSKIIDPEGRNRPVCLLGYSTCYCVQQSAHWGAKSVNRCWCAQRTNSKGSTNCMPSPPL